MRLVTFNPDQFVKRLFNESNENPRKKSIRILLQRKAKCFSKGNLHATSDHSNTSIVKVKRFLAVETDKYKIDPLGLKILVVDDIDIQRDIVESVIKGLFSAKIDTARDGRIAIERFKNFEDQGFIYNLIFMDVYMPVADGIKATQAIREIEFKKCMPKTFICGMSGDSNLRQKCISNGMDEFGNFYVVQKPPSPADLKRIVEMTMNNQ